MEMARQAKCLTNHRAMVNALAAYHEANGSFPLNYGWYWKYRDNNYTDRNNRWALAYLAPHLGMRTDEPYLRHRDEGQFPNAYICPSADLDLIYTYNPDDKYHACYWTNVAIRANRGFEVGLFNDWTGQGHPAGWDSRIGGTGGEARQTGKTCPGCHNWRCLYNPTMQSVPLPAKTVWTGDTNNEFPDENANGSKQIAYDSYGGHCEMWSNAYYPGFWHVRPGWGRVHAAMGFDRHNEKLLMSYLDGSAKAVTHRYLDDNYTHRGSPRCELIGDWIIAFPPNHGCQNPWIRPDGVVEEYDRMHFLPEPICE